MSRQQDNNAAHQPGRTCRQSKPELYSARWLRHQRPAQRTLHFQGAIAQLGERFNGIEEVVGSIPSGSTITIPLIINKYLILGKLPFSLQICSRIFLGSKSGKHRSHFSLNQNCHWSSVYSQPSQQIDQNPTYTANRNYSLKSANLKKRFIALPHTYRLLSGCRNDVVNSTTT